MHLLTRYFYVSFSSLALVAHAQVAPDFIARKFAESAASPTTPAATNSTSPNTANALPLRNVQIEVRQVQQQDSARSGIQTSPRVAIDSSGQVNIGGQLQLRQRQSSQSNSASQFAVVLNGNSTRINLGTSTPLRLMQSWVRNGVVVVSQSAVMIERGTGFVATPRWDGSNQVVLEIEAQQSTNQGGMGNMGNTGNGANPATWQRPSHSSSQFASTLVLSLGEWTTVAQTEQDSAGTTSSLGGVTGTGNQSGHTGSEVQIRLTLK